MQSWLPNPYRIVVLGGGLSGLSAAHALLKHSAIPCEVKVIESGPDVGGWLSSTRFEDDSVMESGPRTARSYGNVAEKSLNIISELPGIEDRVIGIPKAGTGKRRYIYAGGEICELPSSLVSMSSARRPFTESLLWSLLKEMRVKKGELHDESIYDFFARRFGVEIAQYMSTSLCRGIFGGDARKLSIRSCFPMLFDHEQRHGSIVKAELKSMLSSKFRASPAKDSDLVQTAKSGNWMAWTLKNGIQTLPEMWADHLSARGVEILTDTECNEINFIGDNKVYVHTSDGVVHECERVISALPTNRLSQLLHSTPHMRLSQHLNTIKYASMAVVTLEYKNITLPVNGFGVLVPASEPCNVLGVTFDSLVIPQHTAADSTVLTVMAGGAWFDDIFGDVDNGVDMAEVEQVAVHGVAELLGVTDEPHRVVSRVHARCIPQYARDRTLKMLSSNHMC